MSAAGLEVLGAAAFAGAAAVGVTMAIERWGGVVGGLLGTLPTTIVPAAVGIHATSDPESFRAALYATPAGMLANAFFLYLWREIPARWKTGLLPTLGLTLGGWALSAAALTGGLALLRKERQPLLPWSVGLLAATVLVGALACRQRPPAPRAARAVGPLVLIARGLLAALAIGVAVLLAGSGVPLVAGMAAVFPAIFLTTMVSLWLAQGEAVPAGAVGPMMLGSSSVSAFALLASWTLPEWGATAGSLVAWLAAALIVTVPASWWLRRSAPPRPS